MLIKYIESVAAQTQSQTQSPYARDLRVDLCGKVTRIGPASPGPRSSRQTILHDCHPPLLGLHC